MESPEMNASELALAMLEWEQKRLELDKLEWQIREAVLELETTQTVGNVRATFNSGRTKYDYETPGKNAPEAYIETYSKKITDWRAVCEAAYIDPVVLEKSDPSVTIKLLKK